MAENANPIDPGVDIGHVHLKVADLDRALDFYCGVLGFELQQRIGDDAAFVSAGGYHHHIGLNTWHSRGGSPPPPGTTGLFHAAIRYPTRRALADALRRLSEAGIPLGGASDHGVSEALYLERPRRQRPRALLGPPARGLAPRRERRTRHVHRPARPPGSDLGARLAATAAQGPLNPIAKQGPPPQLSLSWIAPSKKSETSCCSAGVARGAPWGSAPVRFGWFS